MREHGRLVTVERGLTAGVRAIMVVRMEDMETVVDCLSREVGWMIGVKGQRLER